MTSALQNEADWLPDKLEQLPAALKHLRAQLTAAGRPSSEIHGITGWIVAKALGDPDTTTATTRAKYRRILLEVGATDPTAPKGRKRRGDDGTPIMHVALVTSSDRERVRALVGAGPSLLAGFKKAG